MKQKMSRAKFFKKTLAFFRQLDYTMQVLLLWLIGQAVKTSPSHGENRGSIPLRTAKRIQKDSESFFLCAGSFF